MADAPSAWGTANATLTDPAATSAPSAPQGLTFTRVGNTITLTWNAPASDGGSPIIGWTVDRGAGMSGAQDDIPLIGTGPFMYEYTETATGWIDNPEYNVSVRAYSEPHDGAWSAPVYPYAAPVAHAPSEWGTANATLTDPTPPGGWGPSAWGTADATLSDGGPTSTLVPVAFLEGEWVEVVPVLWDGTDWTES